MEIYILDNKNLNILSVCRPCKYNLNLDEETNGKSEIVLPNLNYAKKGFYLVLNGLYKQFLFVIDDVITTGFTVSTVATELKLAGREKVYVWCYTLNIERKENT